MKTFNQHNLPLIRDDLKAALAAVAKKHGIEFSLGAITFTANTFSSKITSLISDSDVEVENVKWKVDFIKQCSSYTFRDANINVNDFGATVKVAGKTMQIVGAQARKPNIIVKDSNGKCYSYPVNMVQK